MEKDNFDIREVAEVTRPPLGVVPGWLWREKIRHERIDDLTAAMARYASAVVPIKEEWVTELRNLIAEWRLAGTRPERQADE